MLRENCSPVGHAAVDRGYACCSLCAVPADVPHNSKQPFPCQLDLPSSLALLEAAFRNTNSATVCQLDLVFDIRKRARAVVWK